MNGKRSKKLREMAALFCQMQPSNMPNRQSVEQIYNNLKQVHKNKISKK